MTEEKKISVTILLPAGRLPLDIMAKAHELAAKYDLGIYCSTAQNLRLMNVPESAVDELKKALAPLGADFKGPGKFPLPRVCVSQPHCNLGLVDIEELNAKVLERFKDRANTKPKFKIALSACPLSCSGVMTTDIGVHASKKGYEIYVGGKGGPNPKKGRRIKRGATEDEVIDVIESLVEFHDRKTGKKQRMIKLLDDPEFPFAEV
ncbi:MAG: nitrite reductase [Thermodesulfobacteriota bacterium]